MGKWRLDTLLRHLINTYYKAYTVACVRLDMSKVVYQECFVFDSLSTKTVFPLLTTLTLNMSFNSPPKPRRELHLYMKKICFIYLKTPLMYIMACIVLLKKISELHSTFQALVQKPQV